ncbi:hypothetical protein HMPREF0204_14355 [Chryseobacterium gleum ATCC 35910]|uniref:Uncharacterized protein n=1 Tax=Chryseobacterium gleum ATCC 35910 TaxID=525257 RepID=A0ABP2IVX8_CHRGE|nr:hypothetical protein HMPREF0204_14355 [Chryseobacterium gleum ATCC 35910]
MIKILFQYLTQSPEISGLFLFISVKNLNTMIRFSDILRFF